MSMVVTPPVSAKAFCPVFFKCHCCAASGSKRSLIEKTPQNTRTLVTLPAPTVPKPLTTLQVWAGPVGCASTVTA